jgi:hypothetical protein
MGRDLTAVGCPKWEARNRSPIDWNWPQTARRAGKKGRRSALGRGRVKTLFWNAPPAAYWRAKLSGDKKASSWVTRAALL